MINSCCAVACVIYGLFCCTRLARGFACNAHFRGQGDYTSAFTRTQEEISNFVKKFCFPAVRTIHRRKARDQCTKSATRDKLSCDAERREQDIDRNSDNQTNDGNYMTVLPRGQINCADVVNLIFLTRTILVQVIL